MEARHGAKMEENTELKAEGRDVAAELTPSGFGETFRRLHFDDHSSFDEHVDAMKADLLATERDDDRVLAIHPQPSTPQRDLECSRINRLHEAVPQLVVHLEEAPPMMWLSSLSMMIGREEPCD
jgi:hypothetical protein